MVWSGLVSCFVFVVLKSKAILVRHERSESVLQPRFFVQEEFDLLFLDPNILRVNSLLHIHQAAQFVDKVFQLLELLGLFLAHVAKMFDLVAQSGDSILVFAAHHLLLLLHGSELVLESLE